MLKGGWGSRQRSDGAAQRKAGRELGSASAVADSK
jgi:hypothetical protein